MIKVIGEGFEHEYHGGSVQVFSEGSLVVYAPTATGDQIWRHAYPLGEWISVQHEEDQV